MAYFNEKQNFMLHKRQGTNNNQENSQNPKPFPDSPPPPKPNNNNNNNNNSTLPPPVKATENNSDDEINFKQLFAIVGGALIVLIILAGIVIFIRKKLNRERTRNAIRLNDIEWNNSSPEKTSRSIRPELQQQSKNVTFKTASYNNVNGEKNLPLMTIKNSQNYSPINSPQFSSFNNSQRDLSSNLLTSPYKSEFQQANNSPINSPQFSNFNNNNQRDLSSNLVKSPYKLEFQQGYNNSPINSPQFSNFNNNNQRDLSSNLVTSTYKSEFQAKELDNLNLQYPPNSYQNDHFLPSPKQQQRSQPKNQKGQYQHLPRSPRSPLVFKNRTFSPDFDNDDDDDTLRGTPRSPYFFKDEPSVPPNKNEDFDGVDKTSPLSPQTINNDNYNYEMNYNDKKDVKNYNNEIEYNKEIDHNKEIDYNNYNNYNNKRDYSDEKDNDKVIRYAPDNNNNERDYNDESEKVLRYATDNNNNNNNNNNISNGNTENFTANNIKKRCEIISKLDSDLDTIISNLKSAENNDDNNNNNNNNNIIYPDQQYEQYTNNHLQPSPIDPLKNNDTLALSLPSPFKLSWTKDSSHDSLLAPITSTNEGSNRSNSQMTNSVYSDSDSESRTSSIGIKGTNQNVQMDYVQPTQGMIQIEMMEDHIIKKNEMPKESIRKQEPEYELYSPQLMQSSAERNMDIKYVDNKSHIVMPSDTSYIQPLMIQPLEVRPEMSAPVIKETSPKPIVTLVGSKPISPLYDIEGIKRHAEKVLNKKTANKERAEVNEIKKNYNDESSNEETQEKPLVRKKSVRFQAEHVNEETSGTSNFAARKSILINKNDVIVNQDTIQQSSTLKPGNEEEDYRDSYQLYDFDISSYQDNTNSIYYKKNFS